MGHYTIDLFLLPLVLDGRAFPNLLSNQNLPKCETTSLTRDHVEISCISLLDQFPVLSLMAAVLDTSGCAPHDTCLTWYNREPIGERLNFESAAKCQIWTFSLPKAAVDLLYEIDQNELNKIHFHLYLYYRAPVGTN